MKVSLLWLRLEVTSEFEPVISLDFEAGKYIEYVKQEKPTSETIQDLSLTLQSEPVQEPVNFKEIPSLYQGRRAFRDLKIETYSQDMEESDSFDEIKEQHGAQSPRELGSSSDEPKSSENVEVGEKSLPMTIQYFSGNPSVEVTKGILHLYKDKFQTPLDPDIPRSEMICMLGVPAKYTCQDLQKYIAPARNTIEQIKIIRDSIPNQYMVLIKFKDQLSADEFFQEYEGKPYNLLESEFSHLVYVAKVESVNSSQGGYLPVSGLVELPTCPVCLERMDESVDGILTVLCNHSFHNDCLVKWQDACCPVCRYHQTPEETADQMCFECDSKESLWICLICGHIGCGRYQDQHAFQHYQQTAHTFSMHLGNHRVWDYAGDNYVHRLIQSKGDGKLVALDNVESVNNEKMDSLTLEYTYLLTNQLESQRLYFEEKMEFMESDAYDKISMMQASVHKLEQQFNEMEKKYLECDKDKKGLSRKYENVVIKATNIAKELSEEKQLNKCLRENQVAWQQKVEVLEAKLIHVEKTKSSEISELQSEVSDLIRHLEVQMAVSSAEEGIKTDIQCGQVFVEESPAKEGAKSKPRSKKR